MAATVFMLAPTLVPPVYMPALLKGEVAAGNTVVELAYNNLAVLEANVLSGVAALDAALNSTAGPLIVLGHSLGAVVASRWLKDHGPTSTIPASRLSFILLGNPARKYNGLLSVDATYAGPIPGVTMIGDLVIGDNAVPADTNYPVTDFSRQYDIFGDFPNLTTDPSWPAAVVGVLPGWVLVHPFYFDVSLEDPANLSHTEGNITYMLSPTFAWWLGPDAGALESAYARPFGATEPGVTSDGPPIVTPAPAAGYSKLKKRYPVNPITPHGAYDLLFGGNRPKMTYRAYDDSVVFELMGPLSYVDVRTPESIRVLDLKGLIPPWSNITQKGASQDGVTYITSLYDEGEADMTVLARGRIGEPTRRLIRTWIDSWDAKQPGELSFWTQDLGRWWAAVRWGKQPVDNLIGGNWTRQKFGWVMKIYDAFWRSYDTVDEFGYVYATEYDAFDYTTAAGLGTGWTVAYSPSGGGTIHADGTEIVSGLAAGQTATARRDSFTYDLDNQVVSLTIGNLGGNSTFPKNATLYLWARVPASSTPGTDGVRLALTYSTATLSYFVGGAETVLRSWPLVIPPQSFEKWSLVAGSTSNPRQYTVQRKPLAGSNTPGVGLLGNLIAAIGNLLDPLLGGIFTPNGATVMTVVEAGVGSPVGATYRHPAIGMKAGPNPPSPDSVPPGILSFNAADNSPDTQSGFVTLFNCGDQPMRHRFTCIGPGTFSFADGPGSSTMVTLGPLLENQVAQVRTDVRNRGVVDLTATPSTPQQQAQANTGLSDIFGWSSSNNILATIFDSIPLAGFLVGGLFGGISPAGIQPPQGNLYALLKGRFSQALPAKSPGDVAQPQQIKVSIEGGNASSRIIAAGTPLRRYPQ